MRMKAIFLFTVAVSFAISPFLTPGFGGFDPNRFPIPQVNPPVQPAGYAFAIWSVIYLWLLAHAALSLFKHHDTPEWDASRLPMIISLVVGTAWLSVAMMSPIWATVLIWVMLLSALWALMSTPLTMDRWWLRAPIGLYAGWLTAASSVSLALLAAGYGIGPFGQVGWAIVALSIGLIIAVVTLRRAPSLLYGVGVVWALIGVIVQNGMAPVGYFAIAAVIVVAGATARNLGRARRG